MARQAGCFVLGLAAAIATSALATAARRKSFAASPRLVWRHQSKCGGTFTRFLLKNIVREDALVWLSDMRPMRRGLYERDFVVGTIRNPCDLYVSHANFDPGKNYRGHTMGDPGYVRHHKRECNWKRAGDCKKLLDAPKDLSRFAAWVRGARRTDGTGYQSYNFWMQFLRPECWSRLDPIGGPNEKNKTGPMHRNCTFDNLAHDLAIFEPMEVADCWVHTESINEDMRACLEAYASISERTAANIDTEHFDHIYEQTLSGDEKNMSSLANKYASQFGKAHHAIKKSMTLKRHLPSTSKTKLQCAEYFQDASDGFGAALQAAADRWLFEKFGYSTCCGAAQEGVRALHTPSRRPV